MGIITFLSDFGLSDHYVASVKAKIISLNPQQRIVDISHYIEQNNIPHGSFVLRSVFREFPEETVHLVAVDSLVDDYSTSIALKLENHFFIGIDNGFFSLLSNQEPQEVVELSRKEKNTFVARDLMANAAVGLANGKKLTDIGKPFNPVKKLLNLQTKATRKIIAGNIIRVNHQGSLITNIEKQDFDILSKDKNYRVSFGRESSNRIHSPSDKIEAGDCYVTFNHLNLLEIGINKGNASELLGLGYESQVNIYFEPK